MKQHDAWIQDPRARFVAFAIGSLTESPFGGSAPRPRLGRLSPKVRSPSLTSMTFEFPAGWYQMLVPPARGNKQALRQQPSNAQIQGPIGQWWRDFGYRAQRDDAVRGVFWEGKQPGATHHSPCPHRSVGRI